MLFNFSDANSPRTLKIFKVSLKFWLNMGCTGTSGSETASRDVDDAQNKKLVGT